MKTAEMTHLPKMVSHLAETYAKHVSTQQKAGFFQFHAADLPSSKLQISSAVLGDAADRKFLRELSKELSKLGYSEVYCLPNASFPNYFDVKLK